MAEPDLRSQLKQQLAQQEPEPESGAGKATSGAVRRPSPFERARGEDLVSFYRQFSLLVTGGHPMGRSLEILERSATNKHLALTIADIGSKVDSGRTLDEAMEAHPWYFSRSTLAVVRAAHEGGKLEEALFYLADSSEHAQEIRSRIESALAYPLILLGITLMALLLMLFYVIPQFSTTLARETGTQFTGFAGFVLAASEFVRSWYGIPIIVGLFVGFVALVILLRKRNPETTDRMLGRVPILGRLMLLAQTSQFTDVLHILIKHGVPLPQALSLASDGIHNAYLQNAMERARAEVEAGRSMVEPLRTFPNLPPVFLELLAVGEYSGEFNRTLSHLSRFLRRQMMSQADRFSVILQPVMLMTTGVIVMAVILVFFLPYFDMLTQLSEIGTDTTSP